MSLPKLCECGCGDPAPIATGTGEGWIKGEPKRFIKNHSSRARRLGRDITCDTCGKVFYVKANRLRKHPVRWCSKACFGLAHMGERNPRYKGGVFQRSSDGRWCIACRDGTSMLYARGVMAAKIGRLLTEDEVVHHVNEYKTDDDPGNLELTNQVDHTKYHVRKRYPVA